MNKGKLCFEREEKKKKTAQIHFNSKGVFALPLLDKWAARAAVRLSHINC